MTVTRIGAAAPVGSPRHVADILHEWADRVEAGEVSAYGLVMVHSEGQFIHLACRPIGVEGDALGSALVKLLAGARLLTDLAADNVRAEMFSEVSVHDLPRDGA